MKKCLFALLILSAGMLNSSAQITSARAMTKRIDPLLQPQTGVKRPAAPAAAPQAPPIDPVKAEAAKEDLEKKRLDYQKKKADEGADYAQYDMGMRYLTGDGVEKNQETAVQWLQKAADNGHSGAKKKLEELKAASK